MTNTPQPTSRLSILTLKALPIAADARLSRTDYTDDQVWEFVVGAQDSPALTLQTRYGGRVGLASLVPMWLLDGRVIYQAQAYARPPAITAFAPGYVRAEANLTPVLALTAEHWTMESRAIGVRYTLTNTGKTEISLRLDLFGQVAVGGRPLKLAVVTLTDKRAALSLGSIGATDQDGGVGANVLRPAVMLEQGGAQFAAGAGGSGKTSPKIGQNVSVPPGASVTVRWVHAGLNDLRDSLARVDAWLERDWGEYFRQIEMASEAIPSIETGRPDWDAVIALSYHHLMQSLLKPGVSLPYVSFVATRQLGHGYSPAGDGSDHERSWSGQTPQLAYPVALALASIDAQAAQGLLLNYLAVQTADGAIDARPGMAGQRAGFAALPILAQLAWGLYTITGDQDFLREVAPKLRLFLEYWVNRGGDSLPTWDDERQTGYLYFPTFGTGSHWAQNADIRLVIGPDMAAYLYGEAAALRDIAHALNDADTETAMNAQAERFNTLLMALWADGEKRFSYRDRDARAAHSKSVTLLHEARADEEHFIAQKLPSPARLIVRVTGGTNKTPRMTLTLNGVDADGKTVMETVSPPEFGWYRGYGVYTTAHVYSQLDRVQIGGLSRVYKLDLHTLDTTRTDINTLLALRANLGAAGRAALAELATNEAAFYRPTGISMVPATDEAFDPANHNGSGGVWPFWAALVGEGLWASGKYVQTADLLKRLLTAQGKAFEADGQFHEFYHSDEGRGLGEGGHLGGIAPLYLLNRVLGVVIPSSTRAWVGGPFVWGTPVTVRQHGVTVTRSERGTTIAFPSGHVAELGLDAPWTLVTDDATTDNETVVAAQPDPLIPAPPPETLTEAEASGKVIIQVQFEES